MHRPYYKTQELIFNRKAGVEFVSKIEDTVNHIEMKPYKSSSGKSSGVTAYHLGSDYIIVQFNSKEIYKYSYKTATKKAVDVMKKLALSSAGLSTYISQNDPGYER